MNVIVQYAISSVKQTRTYCAIVDYRPKYSHFPKTNTSYQQVTEDNITSLYGVVKVHQ